MTRQEILAVAKPILFNTDMVRAILDDRKTATRRVIKPRYRVDEAGFQVITTRTGEFIRVEKVDEDECGIFPDGRERHVSSSCQPGDYLYVRETWNDDWCDHVIYKADSGNARAAGYAAEPKWRPSIHMPKEAALDIVKRTAGDYAAAWTEIRKLPAEDVEPVAHGEWLMNSDRPDKIICSKCDAGFDVWKHEAKDFHRCPSCGAKMQEAR